VAPRSVELSPTGWVDRFRNLGYRDSGFVAAGMEGLVFRVGDGLVAKVWSSRTQCEVERLKVFYSELAQHRLPFATPEIREIAQIEGSVASIERELTGTPLQRSSEDDDARVAPAIVDCLIQVLQALASVPGDAKFARFRFPVLGEAEALWGARASW